jgi:hypothetical protein
MEIVNKQYTRNGTTDILTVANLADGFVHFNNGAQCKLETFLKDFNEVGTINENKAVLPKKVLDLDHLDPDTFFDGHVSDDDPLVQQLEQLKNNPNMQIQRTVESSPSKDLTDNKIISNNISNQPSTINHLYEQPVPTQGNERNIILPTVTEVNQVKENRLPEFDMFDRIKKTEDVEFYIPIKIKLPKASILDTFNNMFDTTTSYTSYITKQTITELLKNDKKLLIDLNKQIDNWLLTGTVEVTKKKETKQSVKKSTKKEIKSIAVEDYVAQQVIKPIGDIDSIRGNFKLNPNVPISIENDDDLVKIKARIEELNNKELTKETENELDSLENMIIVYKNK